jgi:transposase-like protein
MYSRTAHRPSPTKYPVVGETTDIDGYLWDIRDIRATRHGFDLYFGTPNDHGVQRQVGNRRTLILTEALENFWYQNRLKGDGFLFDLPAGRTTLKRARRKLGMNFLEDRIEFWMDRFDDLESLSVKEFAARHEVDKHLAFAWRRRIVGVVARKPDWWRTPRIREVLLSGMTLIRIGRKLGISTSHAFRLRIKARQELAVNKTVLDTVDISALPLLL